MTMKKVTVSLPEDTAQGVAAAVEAGGAASFSAYVASATAASLARDQALAALRAHTGGPHGGELRARAARLFGDPVGSMSAESSNSADIPDTPDTPDTWGGTASSPAGGRRKAS